MEGVGFVLSNFFYYNPKNSKNLQELYLDVWFYVLQYLRFVFCTFYMWGFLVRIFYCKVMIYFFIFLNLGSEFETNQAS
jgi:hypothetical protein